MGKKDPQMLLTPVRWKGWEKLNKKRSGDGADDIVQDVVAPNAFAAELAILNALSEPAGRVPAIEC
eukprot:1626757-Pyramimonas_sp.AAC.1